MIVGGFRSACHHRYIPRRIDCYEERGVVNFQWNNRFAGGAWRLI